MVFETFEITMADNGIVRLPEVVAREYGPSIVLCKGGGYCLILCRESLFHDCFGGSTACDSIAQRNLRRFVSGGAYSIELEDSGQLDIPENLASYAGLDSSLVLLCVGDYVRLMPAVRWSELRSAVAAEANSVEMRSVPRNPLPFLKSSTAEDDQMNRPDTTQLLKEIDCGHLGPERELELLGVTRAIDAERIEMLVASRSSAQSSRGNWLVSCVTLGTGSLEQTTG